MSKDHHFMYVQLYMELQKQTFSCENIKQICVLLKLLLILEMK